GRPSRPGSRDSRTGPRAAGVRRLGPRCPTSPAAGRERRWDVRRWSRRQFVTTSLGATAAALGGNSGVGCRASVGGRKVLRISNWPLYIDDRTIPEFQQATGITVQYHEDINDNNEFFAKIAEPLRRGQSIDRDIIVLTDWVAGRVIRLGYATPLDQTAFPNRV